MEIDRIEALTFDVFGTVVDWRSSIIREGEALGRAKGLEVDWVAFADAWRGRYTPSMDRVRHGEMPWTKLDDLHRMSLDGLLEEFAVTGLSEAEIDHFNRAWHRLEPWPDVVEGLTRLKSRFILATLSNGNISLMVNLARHAGLPWDAILGAELAEHFKKDPEVYLKAADCLSLRPEQCLMVAAHNDDLQVAASLGFRTAFVGRPTEYGPHQSKDFAAEHDFDVIADSFIDLADHLGC
jgi:2-haloacid dehalogenase